MLLLELLTLLNSFHCTCGISPPATVLSSKCFFYLLYLFELLSYIHSCSQILDLLKLTSAIYSQNYNDYVIIYLNSIFYQKLQTLGYFLSYPFLSNVDTKVSHLSHSTLFIISLNPFFSFSFLYLVNSCFWINVINSTLSSYNVNAEHLRRKSTTSTNPCRYTLIVSSLSSPLLPLWVFISHSFHSHSASCEPLLHTQSKYNVASY